MMQKRLRENGGINIFNIIIFSIILKVLTCFIFGNLDLFAYSIEGNVLNFGLNPYDPTYSPLVSYQYLPGFFFELVGGWFFIFGNSVFSLRLFLMIFDVGSSYILYKIGILLKDYNQGVYYALLYNILPFGYISLLNGNEDTPAIFFLLVSIYYFIKDRRLISSLFMGAAICIREFPILVLLVIIIYYFKRKEKKAIIVYVGIVIIFFLITSIPFLILTPQNYIEFILMQSSRKSTGIVFVDLFPQIFRTFELNIFNFMITISINFVIQLSCVVFLAILFLIDKRELSFSRFFKWNAILFLSLPIIMYRGNIDQWIWCLPYIIILNKENPFYIKSKHLMFLIISMIIVFIFYIIESMSVPISVFHGFSIDELADNYDFYFTYFSLNSARLTGLIYTVICGILFFIYFRRINIISIACLIYFLDNIFYSFMISLENGNNLVYIVYFYYFLRIIILGYCIYIIYSEINKNWSLILT